jgi:hypothetical protein
VEHENMKEVNIIQGITGNRWVCNHKQEIIIYWVGNDLILMWPLFFGSKKKLLIKTEAIKHSITDKIVHAHLIKTLGCFNLNANVTEFQKSIFFSDVPQDWG